MSPDPREKDRVTRMISSGMKELNAIVAIMITDTSVANKTPGDETADEKYYVRKSKSQFSHPDR
jgi:hypothetical protein